MRALDLGTPIKVLFWGDFLSLSIVPVEQLEESSQKGHAWSAIKTDIGYNLSPLCPKLERSLYIKSLPVRHYFFILCFILK